MPVANKATILTAVRVREKINLNTSPTATPVNRASSSSPNKSPRNFTLNGRLFSTALAADEFTANTTMTTTSVIIVTPSTVCVNGPFARISLTITIAEEENAPRGSHDTRAQSPAVRRTTSRLETGCGRPAQNRSTAYQRHDKRICDADPCDTL